MALLYFENDPPGRGRSGPPTYWKEGYHLSSEKRLRREKVIEDVLRLHPGRPSVGLTFPGFSLDFERECLSLHGESRIVAVEMDPVAVAEIRSIRRVLPESVRRRLAIVHCRYEDAELEPMDWAWFDLCNRLSLRLAERISYNWMHSNPAAYLAVTTFDDRRFQTFDPKAWFDSLDGRNRRIVGYRSQDRCPMRHFSIER